MMDTQFDIPYLDKTLGDGIGKAMINVLLVEPVGARCEALRSLLSQEKDINVVGAGRDLVSACLENLPPSPIDVLIMGVHTVEASSNKMWAQLHLLLPEVRVMVLTGGEDDNLLLSTLGARPLSIHKCDAERETILRAIRYTAHGKVDIDQAFLDRAKMILTLYAFEDVLGRHGGMQEV
jgi:DNA-binding NarL/FixJ family response regulator